MNFVNGRVSEMQLLLSLRISLQEKVELSQPATSSENRDVPELCN